MISLKQFKNSLMNDSNLIYIEGVKSINDACKNAVDITNVHIFDNKKAVYTYSCSQFLEKISDVIGVKIEFTDDKSKLDKLSNFIDCYYHDTNWSISPPNNDCMLFGVVKKVGDTDFTVHTR